jgi:hypothetical protein
MQESWDQPTLSRSSSVSVPQQVVAGVPQSIAMKLSGHKTDSMFRRYAIVDESVLRTALRRTQDHLKTTAKKNVAAMPVKIGPASVTAEAAAAVDRLRIRRQLRGQSCRIIRRQIRK